eukprot:PhM_4_TR394/c2_g5_i3/m.49694
MMMSTFHSVSSAATAMRSTPVKPHLPTPSHVPVTPHHMPHVQHEPCSPHDGSISLTNSPLFDHSYAHSHGDFSIPDCRICAAPVAHYGASVHSGYYLDVCQLSLTGRVKQRHIVPYYTTTTPVDVKTFLAKCTCLSQTKMLLSRYNSHNGTGAFDDTDVLWSLPEQVPLGATLYLWLDVDTVKPTPTYRTFRLREHMAERGRYCEMLEKFVQVQNRNEFDAAACDEMIRATEAMVATTLVDDHPTTTTSPTLVVSPTEFCSHLMADVCEKVTKKLAAPHLLHQRDGVMLSALESLASYASESPDHGGHPDVVATRRHLLHFRITLLREQPERGDVLTSVAVALITDCMPQVPNDVPSVAEQEFVAHAFAALCDHATHVTRNASDAMKFARYLKDALRHSTEHNLMYLVQITTNAVILGSHDDANAFARAALSEACQRRHTLEQTLVLVFVVYALSNFIATEPVVAGMQCVLNACRKKPSNDCTNKNVGGVVIFMCVSEIKATYPLLRVLIEALRLEHAVDSFARNVVPLLVTGKRSRGADNFKPCAALQASFHN